MKLKISLIAVVISALMTNISWAITPGGNQGNSPAPEASSVEKSSGIPLLEKPTKEDVKKALGIGQLKSRDGAALKALGFGSFIEFDSESAVVVESEGLTAILSALVDLEADSTILITGHTDNHGTNAYNMKLSKQRAEAVRKYLESKGVRNGAIKTKGVGFHKPIATNGTEEGRRQNRRVEFTRLDEGASE